MVLLWHRPWSPWSLLSPPIPPLPHGAWLQLCLFARSLSKWALRPGRPPGRAPSPPKGASVPSSRGDSGCHHHSFSPLLLPAVGQPSRPLSRRVPTGSSMQSPQYPQCFSKSPSLVWGRTPLSSQGASHSGVCQPQAAASADLEVCPRWFCPASISSSAPTWKSTQGGAGGQGGLRPAARRLRRLPCPLPLPPAWLPWPESLLHGPLFSFPSKLPSCFSAFVPRSLIPWTATRL